MRYKDINACLMAGLAPAVIAQAVLASEPVPPRLKTARDFEADIWHRFWPAGGVEPGLTLPWGADPVKHPLPIRFRNGEWSLWYGYNFHGKSQMLLCLICGWIARGARAVIASYEMPAHETYRRMIRMMTGQFAPFRAEDRAGKFAECLAWLSERLWVEHHRGAARIETTLELFRYARRRYGCEVFVIDNLMLLTCGSVEHELYAQQSVIVQQITDFCEEEGVHIHLVAHVKKPDKGEHQIPSRYSVSGGKDVSDKAWNAICVQRNVKKREELADYLADAGDKVDTDAWLAKIRAGAVTPKQIGVSEEEFAELKRVAAWWDAYLKVDKQRGGEGDTPARRLWFDAGSLQFLDENKPPWLFWQPGQDQTEEL